MLYKLKPNQFALVEPLIGALDEHLSIAALLAGNAPGSVCVDHPTRPRAAFLQIGARVFLAGAPEQPAFLAHLRPYLQQAAVPRAKTNGQEAFLLHLCSPDWEPHLPALLEGFEPHTYPRQYYEARALKEDWRPLLPEGYELLPVSAELIARGYANTDELLREMCSERPSVDDFLAHSFGFVMVHDGALVAWCLSEYNTAGRCEVGIATAETHRRRGLGTVAALALVEDALARGYQRVGWHCWKNNRPSALLALRAGFALVSDFPVWLWYWETRPARPIKC